jgi:hypothetical protein
MKKGFYYIISILFLILSSLFIYIKSVIDSIEFKLNLDDLHLTNLSFDSIKNDSSNITVKLEFLIRFFAFFNISFSDLKIKAYYENKLIGSSLNNLENLKKITLVKNKVNKIYYSFSLNINSLTVDLIKKIKGDKKYLIDYDLSFKILGLDIKYSGRYEGN